MNILFAYGFCGLGGVETAILNRCEALRARGIAPTIFFGQFYGEGAAGVADLPDVHVGLDHAASLFGRRFDAVCVVDYPDFIPVLRQASPASILLLETHASVTTRLVGFHRLTDDPSVAGVIVPSRYNRERVLGVSEGRRPIYVVPNGIDLRIFRARPMDELRVHFGSLTTRTVVLWVGRLEDEKNPQAFVELSRAIAGIRANAHFICIGDAPQDPDYSRRLQENVPGELRDRYTFIPSVPNSEMPLYYSLAGATGGCLVSTSHFESVPMIFIEAMACGCPVLSTNVGGVQEIITDGVTGLLFEPDDEASAIRAAGRLFAHGAFRLDLIRQAGASVSRDHSLESTGARFIEVLDLVVSQRLDRTERI